MIALLPILVVLWLPLLSGGAKPAPSAPATATEPVPSPPSAPLAETVASRADLAGLAPVTRLGERIQDLMLPFQPRWQPAPEPAPPGRDAGSGSLGADGPDTTRLTPSTILISPGRPPIAIVQGRPCQIGDSIFGHTLVAIAEQHVLYRSGSDTVTVRLPATLLGGQR